MAAVTTSTSPRRRAKYRLGLIDETSQASCAFSLHEVEAHEGAARFELAREGTVHESHAYGMVLISDGELDVRSAILSVNGEDPVALGVDQAGSAPGGLGGEGACARRLRSAHAAGGEFLFRQTYGFALVEVTLILGDGSRLSLATDSIACACDRRDQEAVVSRMVDELTSGAGSRAIGLLLSPEQKARAGLSLVEAGQVSDGSKSLRSFLSLCEEVVRTYEANLPLFRARAHSRVLKREEVVKASAVRRFGRSELLWLARTPEALREARGRARGPIVADGASYLVSRV